METEKIATELAEELFGILNSMTDSQKHQAAVIDKITDGLASAVNVIYSMQQRIKALERRVVTLEKRGRK